MATMCFPTSNSTRDLLDGKQKLFHQIKNDNKCTYVLRFQSKILFDILVLQFSIAIIKKKKIQKEILFLSLKYE